MTTPSICSLGLGTIWFGRQWPPGNSSYESPEDAEIDQFMRTGLERLYVEGQLVMVDTATAYGTCEKRLGEWLKRNADWRDKILLATKWGGSYEREVSGDGKIYNMSLEQLKEDYAHSVSHLGKIDVLYWHLPGQVPFDEAIESLSNKSIIEFLTQLRKDPEDRSVTWIGASISSNDVLETALKKGLLDWLDILQIPARIAQQNADLWAEISEKPFRVVLNSPVRHSKTNPKEANLEVVLDQFSETVVLTGTRTHLRECLDTFKLTQEMKAT